MDTRSLKFVYDGWDGYNTSLIKAIEPRTPEELAWRAKPGLRSVGEVAGHIALGRVDWFTRMGAPLSAETEDLLLPMREPNGEVPPPAIAEHAAKLVMMLQISWRMVEATLEAWTVDDLTATYLQPYQGKTYQVSAQWTTWRILCHDLHHGGQISEMLYAQGIEILELGYLGGHLTEPPVVSD